MMATITKRTPVMTWEYRLVAINLFAEGDPPLELRKVYYNDDGSLRAHVPFVTLGGDDPAAILADLRLMEEACGKPTIDANDFPELEPPPKRGGPITFTLSTRLRPKSPPERKTPELRVVPKTDSDDP
ncbi:hypothetical protein [Variovorax sp. RA8]|uniref:hypothetical protein n=1 Tax=Variovorax sp. (strain JCM 16519 / RA8) TaxID=662548 RepID=UPI0013A552B7|nr:hypothetical protein [Variovorax sp. RA8]